MGIGLPLADPVQHRGKQPNQLAERSVHRLTEVKSASLTLFVAFLQFVLLPED